MFNGLWLNFAVFRMAEVFLPPSLKEFQTIFF